MGKKMKKVDWRFLTHFKYTCTVCMWLFEFSTPMNKFKLKLMIIVSIVY